MTTWQEDVQRACAAGFAAWGGLVDAWSNALLGTWAAVTDWAVEEQVEAPPNATAILLHSGRHTRLHGQFHRADDEARSPIPAALVTFEPPVVPAMPPDATVTVIVRISPGTSPSASGPPMTNAGYVGVVVDDLGAPLSPVPVYVPVHVPWAEGAAPGP